jgi:hypothetical protein
MFSLNTFYLNLKLTGRLLLAFLIQYPHQRKNRIKALLPLINKSFSQKKKILKNETVLDVIIPAIPVDLPTLPFVIKGLRKNLFHPIDKILIVSPDSQEIKEFCRIYNCTFVNEDTVLPFGKDYIHLKMNTNRAGWIFQQLLKLNADQLTNKKYCLVLDADTILIQPQVFIVNGKEVLNCADEYHLPYFSTYKKITGEINLFPLSFVTHHTLFAVEKLKKLKNKIESHTQLIWYDAILANIDQKEYSSFSEYETYGNFVASNYPSEIEIYYWLNKSINRNQLNNIEKIISKYLPLYKTLSVHSYYQN